MIVSLKEFDRRSGRDLPLFSRSGRLTNNQYLAFQNKPADT